MRSPTSIALPSGILVLTLLAGCAAAPRRQEYFAHHPYVRDTAYFLLGMAAEQLLTTDPTVQSWTPQYGDNMAQWTTSAPGGVGTSQCYASGAQQWCTSPPGSPQ